MYKINKLILIEPDERNESLTSEITRHERKISSHFFLFCYQRTEKSCMHRGSAQIAPSFKSTVGPKRERRERERGREGGGESQPLVIVEQTAPPTGRRGGGGWRDVWV